MATLSNINDFPAARPTFVRTAFNWVVSVLSGTSTMLECARQAEYLTGLSDEELAKRGMTREQIFTYAFRPYLGQ